MRANHSVLQAHGPANTPYTSAVALAQNKLLVNTPLLVAEERGKPTCLVSAQMSETHTSREFGHFFFNLLSVLLSKHVQNMHVNVCVHTVLVFGITHAGDVIVTR